MVYGFRYQGKGHRNAIKKGYVIQRNPLVNRQPDLEPLTLSLTASTYSVLFVFES